jgi:1,4-dihydroxy-2-naphthoate octaprenyltransferase
LPALVGTLQGICLAGGIRWWAAAIVLLPGWALQRAIKDLGERFGVWRELTAVLLGGYGPALLACGLQSGDWFDRRTLILATPIAIWFTAAVLVDGVHRARVLSSSGAHNLPSRIGDAAARSLFLGLHTSALIIIGFAIVADEVRWGMIVLPLAVFRLAAGAADAILSGAEFERSVEETREIALKAYLVGAVWVAGWSYAPAEVGGRFASIQRRSIPTV